LGLRQSLAPHLVAAAVLWHGLAMVFDATPDTSAGLRRQAWKEPTVQAEFASYAELLGVEEPVLEEQLWAFATGWNTARGTLIAPFRRYLALVHCSQSWQMFVAPHTTPSRLQVQEMTPEGGWATLFEERDPEHTWMVTAFGTERMRASVFRWSWPSYESSWKRGCQGLAEVRFAESETTAVRCRFWQAPTPSPDQVLDDSAPPGRWVREQVVRRPK